MEIYPVDESCSVVTRTHLGNAIGWNPTYKPETAWLKFAKFAVNRDFHKECFAHEASIYANSLEQKKAFYLQKKRV